MTALEFSALAERLAKRLDVPSPSVRILRNDRRRPLEVQMKRWRVRVCEEAFAELSDAELSFGLAYAMLKRLDAAKGSRLIQVAAPFIVTTLAGIAGVSLGQEAFYEHRILAFAVLLASMVSGCLIGMFISTALEERAERELIAEALNLTGNASAAETYLIRCSTDHIMTGSRRLGSADRERLDDLLAALNRAARQQGLDYVRIGLSD